METGSRQTRMIRARESAKGDAIPLDAAPLKGRLRTARHLTMAEAVAVKWIGRYASPVKDDLANSASD
jgi:hypothetical protein